MPGIVTHHAFGRKYLQLHPTMLAPDENERNAFLLGNQGPDPFFTLSVIMPDRLTAGKLGTMMHTQNTSGLLQAISERMVASSLPNNVTRAYALGFACHYLLDSTLHPLVYAQQRAISERGPAELRGKGMEGPIHSTIETEWDEYVFCSELSATVKTMPPHANMLRCREQNLLGISRAFADVVLEAYGTRISTLLFFEAVNLFRLAQAMLDSKSTGLRKHFDYLVPVRLASPHIQVLSHIDACRTGSVFANDDHVMWPSAFEDGEIVSKSFDELFSEAMLKAHDVIPRFDAGGLSEDELISMGCNRDFHGRALEHGGSA